LPSAYAYLAEAHLGQGNTEEALRAAQLALELAQNSDTPEYIGVAWRILGMVSERMISPIIIESKRQNAADCFKKSEQIFAEAEIKGERARTLREWARSELKLGNKEHGLTMWQEARKIFKEIGAHWEVGRMIDIPQ
jgi:tetratricopeptide (TPR) repeat protein